MLVTSTQNVPTPHVPSVAEVCTPPRRPATDRVIRGRQATTQAPPPASHGFHLSLSLPKMPPRPTHLSPGAQALVSDLKAGHVRTVDDLLHRASLLSNNDVNDVGLTAYYNGWIGLFDSIAMYNRSNHVRSECVAAGGNPDNAATQRAMAPAFMNDPRMRRVAEHLLKNASS